VLAAALLPAACFDGGGPLAAVGAPYLPFDAPALYREWWTQVEACANRTAAFDRVEWQRVTDGADGTFACGRARCSGAWAPPHTIYLAESHVWSEPLVKHEMVHDLIQSPNHFDQAFYSCGVHDIGHR
jgi:hypothetical protein